MPGTDRDDQHRTDRVNSFRDVPAAEADGGVDPHWLALRGRSDLPTIYLPPAMAGRRAPWQRAIALLLISVFVAATAVGVCLTYGAPIGLW